MLMRGTGGLLGRRVVIDRHHPAKPVQGGLAGHAVTPFAARQGPERADLTGWSVRGPAGPKAPAWAQLRRCFTDDQAGSWWLSTRTAPWSHVRATARTSSAASVVPSTYTWST